MIKKCVIFVKFKLEYRIMNNTIKFGLEKKKEMTNHFAKSSNIQLKCCKIP